MLQLIVILLVVATGSWLLVNWLLGAWLRLRRLGQPFALRNLLVLGQLEAEHDARQQSAQLALGEQAWARRVAGPGFLREVEREVGFGATWSQAVETVLGPYRDVEQLDPSAGNEPAADMLRREM